MYKLQPQMLKTEKNILKISIKLKKIPQLPCFIRLVTIQNN